MIVKFEPQPNIQASKAYQNSSDEIRKKKQFFEKFFKKNFFEKIFKILHFLQNLEISNPIIIVSF